MQVVIVMLCDSSRPSLFGSFLPCLRNPLLLGIPYMSSHSFTVLVFLSFSLRWTKRGREIADFPLCPSWISRNPLKRLVSGYSSRVQARQDKCGIPFAFGLIFCLFFLCTCFRSIIILHHHFPKQYTVIPHLIA